MNILYFHGWGSRFDPTSSKIQTLMGLGQVTGPNLDYTQGFANLLAQCHDAIADDDYDVVVGTSLGGYLASQVGSRWGIPFAAVNPSINPAESLQRYVGSGQDWYGEPYTLAPGSLLDWPLFSREGYGLILLDQGDELIPADETAEWVGDRYPVIMFRGGNHRFAHMAESLEYIRNLVNSAEQVYGLETE